MAPTVALWKVTADWPPRLASQPDRVLRTRYHYLQDLAFRPRWPPARHGLVSAGAGVRGTLGRRNGAAHAPHRLGPSQGVRRGLPPRWHTTGRGVLRRRRDALGCRDRRNGRWPSWPHRGRSTTSPTVRTAVASPPAAGTRRSGSGTSARATTHRILSRAQLLGPCGRLQPRWLADRLGLGGQHRPALGCGDRQGDRHPAWARPPSSGTSPSAPTAPGSPRRARMER